MVLLLYIFRSTAMCIILCFLGYYGYVPAIGKAAIWIRIMMSLYTEGFLSFEGCIPAYIPILGITVYKVNIVHSKRIRLGEMLLGDKKKIDMMHVMSEPLRTSHGLMRGRMEPVEQS